MNSNLRTCHFLMENEIGIAVSDCPPFLVPRLRRRTSSCVYCFKSQKSEAETSEKKWPNADAFYLLNYIDCVSGWGADASGVAVCVGLPARHRRRPVFGGENSGCLEIDFPPTIVCIFLLRVVFRCSRQTLGLETFLLFFFSARSVFSRPILLARLFTN